MAPDADTPEIQAHELADLSALADGTLDPARRKEVQARIAASPHLIALYEREVGVVKAMHEVRAADRAPAALRARIEAARADQARPARKQRAWARTRWHVNMGGMVAGMASAAVIVVVVLLLAPGGAPGAPSVSQAAGLASKPATAGAPSANAGAGRLGTNVGDVYFPDWEHSFGWWAQGARTDSLNGRPATTVYYRSKSGTRIAYTIVSAPSLKTPAARSVTFAQGVEFRTLQLDGRPVVTWVRDNHTCVLSGAGSAVPAETLLKLASSRP